VASCGGVMLAALIASGSVAGCRSRGSSMTADGKVRIRLSGYTGNPAETKLMTELTAEFNAAHSDIEVVYEPIPGQYYPKLLAMLVSKTAPDVFYLDVSNFKPFLAKKKILLPLDKYLAKPGQPGGTHREDFIAPLMDAFSDGDTVYGIPKDFNAYALFYNKEMFDAAGLSYPDDTWDLDQLRDASKKLTLVRPDGTKQYGFVLTNDKVDRFLPIANAFGASLFDAQGHCAIDAKEGIDAMNFYSNLKRVDGCAILPSEVGANYAEDAFGRRSAAMAYDGSWMIPFLSDSNPDVRYGVTELPKGKKTGTRSNFLFTVSYSIPQTSEHPDQAWKLIEFLTSAASQAKITFALPSRKAVSDVYVVNHPEYTPVLKGAGYAKPFEFGPRGSRVQARLEVAIQEVFLGAKSSEAALQGACSEIDRIVAP
jgi:multiple sugar transport system substrate-binding protein